jgi:uncharacterized protein (TIGR03086 family)
MLDLRPPADRILALLPGVTDDQLRAPTPNPGTSVAALLTHLIGLTVAFRDAARKVDGPTTSTAPDVTAAQLPDDWRDLLPRLLDELVTAWQDPAAWDGHSRAGGVSMPATVTGQVANNELVLHGWDLAVATGQPFDVAEDNLEASWQMVSNTPDDPAARQGLYGPVRPVADDAPLWERTLAYGGRDPNWSPEHATT